MPSFIFYDKVSIYLWIIRYKANTMNQKIVENITQLSNYLSEAVYESFTTHDTLNKYQRLINRYAEKAEIDTQTLARDIEDFKVLYEQVAANFVVTDFEEKSLIAQGKLAYIREDAVKKLINFIRTAHRQTDDFDRQEVRTPLIDGQQKNVSLTAYLKADQEFIQKEDAVCTLNSEGKTFTVYSPVSGRLYHKKGVGEELPFGGTICEIAEEKRTGKFEYFWHEGTKYIGDFLEGEPSGKGKFIYNNGDMYVGDTLEGKKNGYGQMKFANGDIYEGGWLADRMQGDGIFTIASLKNFVLFESHTIHQGKAQFILPNGDTAFAYFEEGKFNNNAYGGTFLIKSGIPTSDKVAYYQFKNGDIYYGEFKGGAFPFRGVHTYGQENRPRFYGADILYVYYYNASKKRSANGEARLYLNQELFYYNYFETSVVNGQFLASVFPFARYYSGDIEQGEGKVYLSQYYLDDYLQDKKNKMEDLEYALYDLENKEDEESQDRAKKVKTELTFCKESPNFLYFDWAEELEKAKKETDGSYFTPEDLRFYDLSQEQLKSDDAEHKQHYGVLEGKFREYIPQGIINYSNHKFSYIGELKDLRLHGKGKLLYGNKQWEGQFENNRLIYGKAYKGEKLVYEGEFKDFYLLDDFMNNPYALKEGYYSGKGKLMQEEEYWEGEFAEGKLVRGKFKSKENFSYEGEFKERRFHGKGQRTCQDGSYYRGEWKEGKKHGEGVELTTEGERYEGQFQEGKKHGFGKLSFKNGEVYDGAFQAGLFNGRGSLLATNGDLYEGQWKEGKREGEGTQVLVNEDKTLTGLWKGDKLIKDYNKKSLWKKIFGG